MADRKTGYIMTRKIDWDDPNWGGHVHEDSHGSWVPSAHGVDQ